ncbi:hypothetical protein EV13_2507 [Prochlorococcus sp. MIT 0702]|nr:hypothetical protein EV12_2294 [Prochlorococcus sp. MIT 0701]KGG26373.1 hypothetical protein EV13_2507 [Prochlorococcus sp. MIT 0702]KGG31207.1 hypothetical protein EV14_2578 [Prochlorococcus sp. MIT 0703]
MENSSFCSNEYLPASQHNHSQAKLIQVISADGYDANENGFN